MSENRRPDYRTIFALASILFLAMLLRLLPLTEYAVWGSDSGEYYYLTESLVDDGGLPDDYQGWGFAYPYFAGMESIVAAIVLLCGPDTLDAMVWSIPALASLIVLPIFLITHRAFGDRRAALGAAAVLAVASPSVFITSHPMPGSIGDLLALVLFLVLMHLMEKKPGIHSRDRSGNHSVSHSGNHSTGGLVVLFLVISIALTMAHHFSAYFVILTLGLYLIARTLLYGRYTWREKRIYALLLLVIALSWFYWFVAVPPFRENVVEDAIPVNAAVLSMVIFAITGGLYAFIRYRPGLRERTFVPRSPDFGTLRRIMLVYLALAAASLVALTVFGVPGTEVVLDTEILLYGIPLAVLIAFGTVGPSFARSYGHGIFLYSWLGAISLSLILTSAAGSTVILPYRHIQYLIEPLAIFMGLGMVKFHDYTNRDLATEFDRFDENGNRTTGRSAIAQRCGRIFTGVFASFIVLLLLAAGATLFYPPREMLGGFEEGTTWEEMRAVLWEREHLEEGAKVATDHRLSSLTFGIAGADASWDYAPFTLHAEDYEDCREEIENEELDHVLINDVIGKGAALKQWEEAEPLSEEAIGKFGEPPFVRLYDDGTSQIYRIGPPPSQVDQ